MSTTNAIGISLVGSTIGVLMVIFMPMTAMPQRVAISHSFGALAATLVGIVEYYQHQQGLTIGNGTMAALGFEVLFGSLTITGSLMAFGKLQELVKSAPITYRFQNVSNQPGLVVEEDSRSTGFIDV